MKTKAATTTLSDAWTETWSYLLEEKEYLAKGYARQIVEECRLFEGDFLKFFEDALKRSNGKGKSQRDRERLARSLLHAFQDEIFGFGSQKNHRKLRFLVAYQKQGKLPRIVLRSHFFDQDAKGTWTHYERAHSVITNHALQRLYLRGGARTLGDVKAHTRRIAGWISTINLFKQENSVPIPTSDGLFAIKTRGAESILVTYISKENLFGRALENWEDLQREENLVSDSPDIFPKDFEGKKPSELARATELLPIRWTGSGVS
ncbi:hypothetical protein FGK63_20335 [Ruegeria sediminis]|uniref:Uncharacterized protein n=1 Tax=Ruegeria sediminis TaxID=2583820 RepID=A0ABY2WS11_9RHOB|nr:hypothetical protein [Ruegeria sediminis]TMV02578.1 hypothetical protein FGK63_20335 [Ruegeria sediminis]